MADDVSVRFGAQTDGLKEGVKDSEDQIKSLKESVDAVSESLKSVGELVGVSFGLAEIKEAIDSYAELGEQISRTARITGESTDQIQLFNAAIKLSGGDSADAALTLGILQKNIGDAISKAGPARSAFADMGISLEQLKNTDVVNLLFQMKENLDEAGTSAQASALKMEDMRLVAGRSGAQFLALKGGIEEIKEILDQTGASMSPKMVENADKLAEHTKALSLAFTGLSNTLVDEATPALISLKDEMASALEGYTAFVTYAKQNGLGSALLTATAGAIVDHYSGQSNQGAGPTGASGQWKPAPTRTLHGVDTSGGAQDNSEEQNEIAIEKSDLSEKLEMYRLDEEAKKLSDQAKVDSGKMTNQQMLADLKTSLQGDKQAALDEITDEQASWDQDSTEWEELQNKKLVVAKEFDNQLLQLTLEAAKQQQAALKQQEAAYKSIFDSIDKDMDSMLQGVLTGTQTWQQAMGRMFSNLAVSFDEAIAKMLLRYAAFKAASAIGGVGNSVATAIGNPFQTSQGGAGASNPIAQVLTALTAALSGNTVAQTVATAATSANTATTGVSTAQSTVATAENTVATIGNTIATDALKVVEGIKTLFGYDVGTWSVPSTGPALLHQGEIVLPPGVSAGVRAGTTQVGNAGAGAIGGSAGGNFTININAIDTQSGASFLKQNAAVIAQTLAGSTRNFSSSLAGAWKS